MRYLPATPGRRLALLSMVATLCGISQAVAAEPATRATTCGQTTELDCIRSAECTLVKGEGHGNYTCRDAIGHCERGFRQSADDDIVKDCEARPGCDFVGAECYCPPNVNCACGGGPPAQCVESGRKD